jgi:hypothetical protein
MIEKDRRAKPSASSEGSLTKELENLYLDRLLRAADDNQKEARILGNARLTRMKSLMGALDFSSNSNYEMRRTLQSIAYNLANGCVLLTNNSGAYHAFDSDVPTNALISLQKIVDNAGFPCAVTRQANIRLRNPQDEILTILEDIGAVPSGGDRRLFSISGKQLEAAMPCLETLKDHGASVELWVALEVEKLPVPRVKTAAV